MLKCSICPNLFDGTVELEEHITVSHIKTIPDVVHYLVNLEKRIKGLEDRK